MMDKSGAPLGKISAMENNSIVRKHIVLYERLEAQS